MREIEKADLPGRPALWQDVLLRETRIYSARPGRPALWHVFPAALANQHRHRTSNLGRRSGLEGHGTWNGEWSKGSRVMGWRSALVLSARTLRSATCMHSRTREKAEGSLHPRTRTHLPAETQGGGLCRVSSKRRVRTHFVSASFQVGCVRASVRGGVTSRVRVYRSRGRWQIDDGAQARMLQIMQQNLRQQRHNTALGKHMRAK